ncbi:MAG: cytochrome c [Planctomycetota bacterium]
MKRLLHHGSLLIAAAALAGCMRGGISELPPVHLVLDMDFQPKVKAQSSSAAFSDHRGMRLPVPGTVPHGPTAPALPHRDASNAFVTKNPVPVTAESLQRGRHLFEINCTPCHGYSGQGGMGAQANGIVGRRWTVVIPSFHYVEGKDATANRVPLMPDGEYFDVITNGKSTMPPYGPRIAPEDRWKIIQYVRVLQSLSR